MKTHLKIASAVFAAIVFELSLGRCGAMAEDVPGALAVAIW